MCPRGVDTEEDESRQSFIVAFQSRRPMDAVGLPEAPLEVAPEVISKDLFELLVADAEVEVHAQEWRDTDAYFTVPIELQIHTPREKSEDVVHDIVDVCVFDPVVGTASFKLRLPLRDDEVVPRLPLLWRGRRRR